MTDRTKETLEKLKNGLRNLKTTEEYINYMKFMSMFYNYSFNNVMLIMLQYPEASLVAGYSKWRKWNRYIKKGEKAISVIAPIPRTVKKINEKTGEEEEGNYLSYKAVPVFDISQTEGDPLPKFGIDELKQSVNFYEKTIDNLKLVSRAPIYIDSKWKGEAKGYYNTKKHEIHIKDGMSQLQTIKTMLHEIAHSFMHNEEKMKEEKTDINTREVEAESVAFVVCEYLGLDTSEYSFWYIASWLKDVEIETLTNTLDKIQTTANYIIDKYNLYGGIKNVKEN